MMLAIVLYSTGFLLEKNLSETIGHWFKKELPIISTVSENFRGAKSQLGWLVGRHCMIVKANLLYGSPNISV